MRLLVILASPPTTPGTRTLARLRGMGAILPCASVRAVNLCAMPARDLPALTALAAAPDAWLAARDGIAEALGQCDEVMAAWGLATLAGSARRHRRDQLGWLHDTAAHLGHTHAWTVGGQPRHPSRWHQYVSDVHARTSGGTMEDRLREVLTKVSLSALV